MLANKGHTLTLLLSHLLCQKAALVITQESQTKADKIPDICRKNNIESIPLIEFFIEQKWKF